MCQPTVAEKIELASGMLFARQVINGDIPECSVADR